MRKGTFALALALVAFPAAGEDIKARAARLQRGAIVIDTHEDVPERLQKQWVDIGSRNDTGHVDIPRLKEGGVTGAFFAAYVPAAFATSGGSARKALELVDLIHRLVEAHSRELVFADSPAGIRAAKTRGKIAVAIGIEGGHAIEDSLGALSAFHRMGARYMTLTHTNTNNWADSSGSFFAYRDDPKKRDAEIARVFGGISRLRASEAAVVDQIEHAMRVAGPRAVGLGTDYDGIDDPPVGLEDVSRLPRVTEELLRRGHSEQEVRGVLGENFLKFWERVEEARRTVPPGSEPLPFSNP